MNKAIILLLIITVLKLFSQKENKDASEEYEPVYISKKDYEEARRILESNNDNLWYAYLYIINDNT